MPISILMNTRLKSSAHLFTLIALFGLAAQTAFAAATLIDVDMVAVTTSEVGFAATGLTSTDYWNAFPAIQNGVDTGCGVVLNMKYVNGLASGAGLAVTNAAGGANNGAADSMYSTYLYSGGNITLLLTNLPAGDYSFYLYGHGNVAKPEQRVPIELRRRELRDKCDGVVGNRMAVGHVAIRAAICGV